MVAPDRGNVKIFSSFSLLYRQSLPLWGRWHAARHDGWGEFSHPSHILSPYPTRPLRGHPPQGEGMKLPDKQQFEMLHMKNEGDLKSPACDFHQNRGTTAPA